MNTHAMRDVIQERRLPWFVQTRVDTGRNRYCFHKHNALHAVARWKDAPARQNGTITFVCGFHGKTGGVFAIAHVANLLAPLYDVEFVSFPNSNYNRLLHHAIRLVDAPNMDADIFICDVSCSHRFFEIVKALKKTLIVSCHGLLHASHGLKSGDVMKSLCFADKVHFVSAIQQDSFQLDEGAYTVIPNATDAVRKTRRTNNVGVVGNLNDARKNADESVRMALRSQADHIQLWSIEEDKWHDPRVNTHHWETDKTKIYNSFDVLVFMSQIETFGMTVIEAMSAGIPCLLSPIPAFEQFRACPGIHILDAGQTDAAPAIINSLLNEKDRVRAAMIDCWRTTYSPEVISIQWRRMISQLTGKQQRYYLMPSSVPSLGKAVTGMA